MARRTAPAILAAYKQDLPGATPPQIEVAIESDAFSRTGSTWIAEKKVAQNRAPVFSYRLVQGVAAPIDAQTPYPQGASHALDISLKFDNRNPSAAEPENGAALVATAKNMSRYWAGFAKTGIPVAQGQPAWPAYNLTTRPIMLLKAQCEVVNDQYPEHPQGMVGDDGAGVAQRGSSPVGRRPYGEGDRRRRWRGRGSALSLFRTATLVVDCKRRRHTRRHPPPPPASRSPLPRTLRYGVGTSLLHPLHHRPGPRPAQLRDHPAADLPKRPLQPRRRIQHREGAAVHLHRIGQGPQPRLGQQDRRLGCILQAADEGVSVSRSFSGSQIITTARGLRCTAALAACAARS